MRYKVTQVYTDDTNTHCPRRTRTIEIDSAKQGFELAVDAYAKLADCTSVRAEEALNENDVGSYGEFEDLEEGDTLEFVIPDNDGSFTITVSPILTEGPRPRRVRVTLEFDISTDMETQELCDGFGQRIEVALRQVGLADGLDAVTAEEI